MSRLSPTLELALNDLAKLSASDPEAFCEGVYALKRALETIGCAPAYGQFAAAALRALPGLSDAVHDYARAADELADEPELPLGLAA